MDDWLQPIEDALQSDGASVPRGGDYDRWDLEVRGGLLGCARLMSAVEEHGGGKQLARFRLWPRVAPVATIIMIVLAAMALGAEIDHSWIAFLGLSALAAVLAGWALKECAFAMGAVLHVLDAPERRTVERILPVTTERS